MPYTPLTFRPGIDRERTAHSNEGGWVDGDKVRFRAGFPESIGGWVRAVDTAFAGACRKMHAWVALNRQKYLAVCTSAKVYLFDGGGFSDITPVRETTAAGDVTFSAASGSTTLTVSDTNHGARAGDYVIFSGATGLGGAVTADVLNAEHIIDNVVDSGSYTIVLAAAANASDTGSGGASTVGQYLLSSGLVGAASGFGWGAGGWGAGGWGEAAETAVAGAQLRLYSVDNYGEDFLFNVRDAGIYYWDRSAGASSRAVALSDLAGANRAPTVARAVLTSSQARHAIAFGCDGEFTPGVQDPLLIRFSDQENIAEWETLSTNTAGFLRLSTGSTIVTAVKTRQQTLVFTDASLHALQYVGAPFTFGLSELAVGTTILGPNAVVAVNDDVFWMGDGVFYRYRGAVEQIPCSVREFVFSGLNTAQKDQVFAAHVAEHGEVWWFYPSVDSSTVDRYVVFNYQQALWYYGTMARTAWQPRGVFENDIAAGSDGYLYYHDVGVNDGSTNPASPLVSYIQSAPVDIAQGDKYMLARRVIPDVTFRGAEGSPSITFTLTAQDWPGDGYITDTDGGAVTRTQAVPVEKFTRQQYIRLRGRAMALRVDADQYNTAWRLGTVRVDVKPDGRR